MLIARAIVNKIRPPKLSPREVQDQVDFTRAAVLTTAYVAACERRMTDAPSAHAAGQEIVFPSNSYEKIEREISALKPLARKRTVQLALNDQVPICSRFARSFLKTVKGLLCSPLFVEGMYVVDSHIQRIVLATEETTVTQQVSHRPIKRQSRLWSQRGTKVNGSHHGDNPLLRPTGIQIATKSYAALQAMAPTNIKTVHQTSLLHSRATSIDSECCRLPTTSVLSKKPEKLRSNQF